VKQGCPLSPLFFGLYIDALEPHIAALDDDDGPDLASTPVKLLLYVDDLVLMSRTQRGLQKQLNELGKFCDERDLTVNVKKTKVVVFGSRVNTSPLLYGGLPIEEVASLRYLGVELHRSGSMKIVVEHLAAASKRAVFTLRRRYADLKINDLAIICQLFDALVKPVISYSCELWVNEVATDLLELIHVSFLKLLLGVNGSTLTHIVLSEFGRFPVKLFWQQQALKYHCRLEDSKPSRLIGLAYRVQLTLSSYECLGARRGSWLHKVQAWEGQAGIQQPLTHSVVGRGIVAL